MKSTFVTPSLFTSVLGAALAPSFDTITIPIPSQGEEFTSTVTPCGTVNGFAVVGVPNGTLVAGTTTIFLPPQASASSATFIDKELSATQVIELVPLQGSCAPFELPTNTGAFTDIDQLTAISTGFPTATAAADCPLGTIASTVDAAAQGVIDLINEVTLLSQNLQAPAKQIGSTFGSAQAVLQVVNGLGSVVAELTKGIPKITALSPFEKRQDNNNNGVSPADDATDAIVIALISFVRVHQALLNIVIGRRGLLSSIPFADADAAQLDTIAQDASANANQLLVAMGYQQDASGAVVTASEHERRAGLGVAKAVAGALRSVEVVVDSLAFALIDLIPRRKECAKQQKLSIDGTLNEAIEAYDN
ncbi:uncharacterized protein LTHEOB_8340 [Lasiodiplodia theobromae]|uniref:uncharacterized protein n=1 Tax=Lasiodiplodia theobromae TaxID=45133 RepID=UPI0015C38277|nr:uncharacterized protein LTHEOB_8340 [Lasiodiplodia theobromae]KAF4541759.1 hypothetical protein LTHEOB_8340 [Lasiodiplodia theobromae]